jgi:hypothetical protein
MDWPARSSACRNCRRPIEFELGIGWLHGELPQYAAHPLTCERAEPVEWGSARRPPRVDR